MSIVAVPNAYRGLSEGPIDPESSSVINAVNGGVNAISIGVPLFLVSPLSPELLPGVSEIRQTSEIPLFYGVGVAGDFGGIYPRAGDAFFPPLTPDNPTIAIPGEELRVCTQGRCIAHMAPIGSDINIGDPLTVKSTSIAFGVATSGEPVFARALQFISQKFVQSQESFAAVDIQREGILP